MEAEPEFLEQPKKKEDLPDKSTGQVPLLINEGDWGAVKAQHGEPSVDNSGQCPLDLWKTLDRQFEEYREATDSLSAEEQQRHLLAFMPLFLKVGWSSHQCIYTMQDYAYNE